MTASSVSRWTRWRGSGRRGAPEARCGGPVPGRPDGTPWGWPGVKQRHPMRRDGGLLGAYFNDNGVNLMHDEFFAPLAPETKALLRLAREEAPDYILNLHSHGVNPEILATAYVPRYCKE